MTSTSMLYPIQPTGSPTSVDVSMEYFTVESFEWASQNATKPKVIDEEERKRRHRETQQRFLARKRARIAALQKVVDRLELELELVSAVKDTALLQIKNSVLSAAVSMSALRRPESSRVEAEFGPIVGPLFEDEDDTDFNEVLELLLDE